ncbi:MAG TPA: 16S rRNA (guanine(527)-N(7))-methyltransferase RsmG [Halieaceae bacterium]|nr:16S rRNA (guanine(527)-N(7))-methyltransferase RsmG [Citromicrobium sp.]HBO14007.1 16S rRNA (guanine(527)-N(7))-methyltransferase RsmG [Halieaceae bacterium]
MRDPALAAGCAALGLTLPTAALAALSSYLDLLEKWNRAYNLTAVRERDAMVTRHLLDSLAVLPHLPASGSFVDVGTGPGLPGIPLAIAAPVHRYCLLDSNGKKTRFLFQVKTALALANIRIAPARAEDHRPEQPYTGVLSRAFAALPAMLECCGHLLAPGGAFYAMKAQVAADELAAAEALGYRATVTALAVPGLDEQRSLITLRPETSA